MQLNTFSTSIFLKTDDGEGTCIRSRSYIPLNTIYSSQYPSHLKYMDNFMSTLITIQMLHFSHTFHVIPFPLCSLLWISSTNIANGNCNATAVTRGGPYFSCLNTASFSSCDFISFSASSSSSSCIVHSSLRQLLFWNRTTLRHALNWHTATHLSTPTESFNLYERNINTNLKICCHIHYQYMT